jgi:hypothetical protein
MSSFIGSAFYLLTIAVTLEVRAKRASKGESPDASAASFEARAVRRHLRMTQ